MGMTPIALNRRRFLGCSAAAGLTLGQAPAPAADPGRKPLKVGLIGLGNRGTSLLRSVLEQAGVEVEAVADPEPKHRTRAQGIVEKSGASRPDAYEDPLTLLARPDLAAVVAATPCDLHASIYTAAIRAGKGLYAEKPLALTVPQCDALIAESARSPEVIVHVGHQRRSNPRYQAGASALRDGRFGPLIEARASWTSSNGPVRGHRGWMGRRARSGDWMVEQAIHVWDVLHWIAGDVPIRASGAGRTGLFAEEDPGRDVTDWYTVSLEWPSGFRANFTQSWIDPADDAFTGVSLRVLGTGGGFDFSGGTATFRDRSMPREVWHPGNQDDTASALAAFFAAVRSPEPSRPPVSLHEAREAVVTGLLVRAAVDGRRLVDRSEVLGNPAWPGPVSA